MQDQDVEYPFSMVFERGNIPNEPDEPDEPEKPDKPKEPEKPGTGGLKIAKYDNITGKLAAGAIFEIKGIDDNNKEIKIQVQASADATIPGVVNGASITTGNGTVSIDGLPIGKYLITELTPPPYYDQSPDAIYSQVVEVVGQSQSTVYPQVIFRNNPYGKLKITKIDAVTGLPIPNVWLRIRNPLTGFDVTRLTNASGIIELDDLPQGNYEVSEANSGENYELNPQTLIVPIRWGELTEITFDNQPHTSLMVTKISTKTNQPVPGAVFTLKRLTTGAEWTLVTLADGKATVSNIPTGQYTIQEIYVPEPMILDNTIINIQLDNNKINTYVKKNDQKPTVTLEKYDEKTSQLIGGAEFRLECVDNVFQTEFMLDSSGKRTFTLDPGTYCFKEIAAPWGYFSATERKDFVLNPNEDIVIKFDNRPRPILEIKKIDQITGLPLPGAKFKVTKTENLTVSEYVTNANGTIRIENLDEAIYTIEEIFAPEGYILNPQHKEIQLRWGETSTLIYENVRKSTLIVTKLNGLTYKPVQNTTYRIDYEGENGGIVTLGTYRTDENGQIVIPKVNAGWYTITETIAAPGYSLSKNPITRKYLAPGENAYTNFVAEFYNEDGAGGLIGMNGEAIAPDISGLNVQVTSGGNFVTAGQEIINYPLNSIVIRKAHAQTGELLAGAAFEVRKVTEDVSGNSGTIIGRYTTDNSGVIVITGLEPGGYIVQEIQAPPNFLISENSQQQAWLKWDGTSIVEVTFANIPYGSLLITKTDEQTGAPLAGARFKVTNGAGTAAGNTNGEYVTDSRGEILIPHLKPDSYVVTEIQAPPNYAIDTTPQTVQVGVDGATYKVAFQNQPYGAIVIRKLDYVTKEPLADVEFKVTNSAGAAVGTGNGVFKTNSAGTIQIPNIPKGSYVVQEVKAPENYILENQTQTLEVDYGKSYTIDFYNKHKSGVQIIKIDATTKQPLKGAKFTVYRQSGEAVGIYDTNGEGVIILDNLDPGWYKAAELKAPDGYILDDTPQDFQITANQFIKLTFEDKALSSLQIRKESMVDGKPLAGAIFEVRKQNGEFVGTFTTGASGAVSVPNIEPGWFTIKETKAPTGYIIDETAKTIEVKPLVPTVVTFTNKPLSGIEILKLDSITKRPLSGATFMVNRADGERVGIFKTDTSGKILVTGLTEGIYVVGETIPPDGYALNEIPKNVTVVSGKLATVEFENKSLSGIEILKLDSITKRPLSGATFKIDRANGENIGTYKTDVAGKIIVSDLDEGIYVVSETISPSGYILNEIPKNVTVVSGKLAAVEFENKPLSGIEILKLDSVTKRALPGATFTVERAANGERVGIYKTDAAGKILISNLDEGIYVVTETISPSGYILNEIPKNATVISGKLVTVEFENKPLSGIEILKLDSVTKRPLSGATFTVERAANGERIGAYKTDTAGKILISDLDEGIYVVAETISPSGYILNEIPKNVTATSGKLVTVEFENKPLSGIEILKTDTITHNPLSGATFSVERVNGEKIGTFKTDVSGKILVSGLDEGDYIISETVAPNGYILSEIPKTVIVKSGKVANVEFTNKRKSGLQIIKQDTVTGAPLSGAVFTIYKKSGDVIGEFTTDANGVIILDNLDEGWLKIAETRAPEGYLITEAPKDVEVKYGEFLRVVFTNDHLASLEIRKIDNKTGTPLAGARFAIEKQNGERIGEYTSDGQGIISVPSLQPGFYLVKETKSPQGYLLDEAPKLVEIKTNEPTIVTFSNKKLASLQIKKIDEISGLPLAGAVFVVERQSGEKIFTNESGFEWITDAQGFINIPALEPGFYIVREVKSPANYILDETPKTVEVKTDVPTVVTFGNKPLAGLKIVKLNSMTREPIEGVEFSISKMNDEKIDNNFRQYTFKTDNTGQIYIPNLENGHYLVTETKTADGYFLNAELKTVLVESGKTTLLEILNVPMSSLLIVKTDEKTGEPLKGVVFDIKRVDGQFVQGNILDKNQPNTPENSPNKSTSPNGDISGSYTTDAQGRILINGLVAGEYNVVERKALEGYELDTDVHAVTITPGKLFTLQLTNRQKSGLRLIKLDSISKKPIYNVEFMIFDESGKVIGNFYTDNNGVIDFSNILKEGRYTIRETRPAQGYYADDVPRTVMFKSGEYTEIRWENVPHLGQIQLLKKSADDNEVNALPAGTSLEGAIFEVYAYKSGNLVDRFISGKDGRAVSNPLPLGRYIVREVQAPQWYKLSDKTLDIELEFGGQIIKQEFLNWSANTGVYIKKTGNVEAMSGDEIRYNIKAVQNTGTTPLTDFFWKWCSVLIKFKTAKSPRKPRWYGLHGL